MYLKIILKDFGIHFNIHGKHVAQESQETKAFFGI